MKKIFISVSVMMISVIGFSQDLSTFKLYKPDEKADVEIEKAIKKAKSTGKNVFIQIGGNWCIWCMRFEEFINSTPALDSALNNNYVVYHLNYSKENKNEAILAKYGYPQRFGFPVFLILNANGKLIHTQNSSYLEQGKGYNLETVKGFLLDWSPAALDPSQYK